MNFDQIQPLAAELTDLQRAKAAKFPYARPAVDRILSALAGQEGAQRAVLLDGPRRVGKSVVLAQVMGQLATHWPERSVWYCDFYDPRLKGVGLYELVQALVAASTQGVQPILLLDEVHELGKSWAKDLKFVVDHVEAQLVIADSAAAVVKSELRDALVGRLLRVPLHPLSFVEWQGLRAERNMPSEAGPFGQAEASLEYLRLGGFPAHALQRSELSSVYRMLRDDVVSQALRSDVGPLHGLRELIGPDRLLTSRLASSGAQLSVEDARQASGASRDTTRHWLEALIDTGLVWELMPFTRSIGKYERKQPKLYAVDPSLVGACSTPVLGAASDGLLARQFETAVAQALRVWAEANEARVGFFQRKGGQGVSGEADFVVDHGGRIYMLEATIGTPQKKPGLLSRRAQELGAIWTGVVSLERTRSILAGAMNSANSPTHLIPLHELLTRLGKHDVEAMGW